MIGAFNDLKKQFLKLDETWIDNNVFRLSYKGTFLVFMTASLMVTLTQYFGDPIDCMVDDKALKSVMDTYCWIQGTFSIPSRWTEDEYEFPDEFAFPGVRPPHDEYGYSRYSDMYNKGDEVEKKVHKYYQWVCFVLFIQAAVTYIPRYLWKMWEGKRIETLVGKLSDEYVMPPKKECDGQKEEETEDEVEKKKETLVEKKNWKDEQVDTIVEYLNNKKNRDWSYTFKFYSLEVMNFVNIILQGIFINWFLNYEFSFYGISEVLRLTEVEPEYRPDPMAKVFPKVTKCTFRKYGPSGTIQTHDGLCVLPGNIINEKIYVCLWAWLLFAFSLSSICIVHRLLTLFSARYRNYRIANMGTNNTEDEHISTILKDDEERIGLGLKQFLNRISDWFLLNLICKNLHPLVVDSLIEKLRSSEAKRKHSLINLDKDDSGIQSRPASALGANINETKYYTYSKNDTTIESNPSPNNNAYMKYELKTFEKDSLNV